MKKKLLTLLTVMALVTPLYKPLSKYGYTGVPKINVSDINIPKVKINF